MSRFLQKKDGSSTIEFVVVFVAFIATIFFVLEVTLYLFFMSSLEKAAEAGVRAAVVSSPLVADFPLTIEKTPSGVFGFKCSDATAPCAAFATLSCTGDSGANGCLAAPFDRILNHIRGFNAQITAANVTVSYEDVGLGYAGGPPVPMVTVTIHDVPYQTGIVGLLLTNANVLATLPARSASMTGEDLAS